MVIQPDGKLVVSGSTRQLGSYADFLVARYTTSGALDQSFGSGGIVSTDFQPGWTDYGLRGRSRSRRQDRGGRRRSTRRFRRSGRHRHRGLRHQRAPRSELRRRRDACQRAGGDNGAWGGVIAQPDGKVVIGGNPCRARPLHRQRRPRPDVRHRPKRSRDCDRWRERPRPPAGRKTRHGGIPERAFGHGCQLRDRAFRPLGLARQVVPRRRGDDRLGGWDMARPSPFSQTAGSSSAARPNGSRAASRSPGTSRSRVT